MGLVGRLVWVNNYGKKQCRSLFWKMRAAARKAVKNGGKQHLKFQYDPLSYALNFDDGCCNLGEGPNAFHQTKLEDCSDTVTWVYVIWVQSQECCHELSLGYANFSPSPIVFWDGFFGGTVKCLPYAYGFHFV